MSTVTEAEANAYMVRKLSTMPVIKRRSTHCDAYVHRADGSLAGTVHADDGTLQEALRMSAALWAELGLGFIEVYTIQGGVRLR